MEIFTNISMSFTFGMINTAEVRRWRTFNGLFDGFRKKPIADSSSGVNHKFGPQMISYGHRTDGFAKLLPPHLLGQTDRAGFRQRSGYHQSNTFWPDADDLRKFSLIWMIFIYSASRIHTGKAVCKSRWKTYMKSRDLTLFAVIFV